MSDGSSTKVDVSALDVSVATTFNEMVNNSLIKNPAIYSDQTRQNSALKTLELGTVKTPDGNYKTQVDAHDLARNWVDEAENARSLEVVKREVLTDHLTGLENRRGADLLIDNAIEHIRRGDLDVGGVGFILFDANEFKHVNDSLGHPIGDEVLQTIAEVLKSHLRGYDVCARIGGEEFYAVITGGKDFSAETMQANWGSQYLDTHSTNNVTGKVFENIQKDLIKRLKKLNPDFFNNEAGFVEGSLSYGWSFLPAGEDLGLRDNKRIAKDQYNQADESLYSNKRAIKDGMFAGMGDD